MSNRKVKHMLFPSAQNGGTDSRVFFRRPEDNTIYAILDMPRVRDLRKRRQLDKFLAEQRESGVVLEVAGA